MHYNVMLMGMGVDGAPLDLPPSIVRNGGTIVDSGTTLAYFPKKDLYCFGWQAGGMTNDERSEVILLGDLVLSNKLVVYDLENIIYIRQGETQHNGRSFWKKTLE